MRAVVSVRGAVGDQGVVGAHPCGTAPLAYGPTPSLPLSLTKRSRSLPYKLYKNAQVQVGLC